MSMPAALSAAAPRMINAASQGSMPPTLGRRAPYLRSGRHEWALRATSPEHGSCPPWTGLLPAPLADVEQRQAAAPTGCRPPGPRAPGVEPYGVVGRET